MRSSLPKFASVLVLSVLLGACDDSSSSSDATGTDKTDKTDTTGKGTGTTTAKEDFTVTYDFVAVNASRAYVIERDTSRYCDDDKLQTEIHIDTNEIKLVTANQIADVDADTVLVGGVPHSLSNRLDRIGTGTGFQGKWAFTPMLTPLSGVNASEDYDTYSKSFDSGWAEVSSTKIVQHIVGFRYGMFVSDVMESYKQQFKSFPGITYSISSDSSSFTIASTKTTEKVTMKIRMTGNGPVLTTSSSDQAHASFTQGDNPTSCPAAEQPAWFMAFLRTIAGASSTSGLSTLSPKRGF
jgi:hypothetical protein